MIPSPKHKQRMNGEEIDSMPGPFIDLDLCPAEKRILGELARRDGMEVEEFVRDMVGAAIAEYVRIRKFGELRPAEPVKFEVIDGEVDG